MGGDGGVVATNRRYMRGAGTADHTGDYNSAASKEQATYNPQEIMSTCALTKAPLNKKRDMIVACEYGRLYLKEAAVQALLRRKQQQQQKSSSRPLTKDEVVDELPHVKKLSELYPVRGYCGDNNNDNNNKNQKSTIWTCPITGKALTGSLQAILLINSTSSSSDTKKPAASVPNVICESALKELSMKELQIEYGPFDRYIKLAPPLVELQEIQESLSKRQQEQQHEKEKKRNKKRKDHPDNKQSKEKDNHHYTTTGSDKVTKKSKLGSEIVTTTSTSAKPSSSSSVLKSLFTSPTTQQKSSSKEYKDNLFAR